MSNKLEFIELFIKNAPLLGVSTDNLSATSEIIYKNKNGYVLDFYSGLSEVVSEIEAYLDNKLYKADISEIKSITQKVRLLLVQRIYNEGKNKPILLALNEYYKSPKNFIQYKKVKWSSVDKIWKLAGDTSLDWNYYTKRSLLYIIYSDALSYYLNNPDENFEGTLAKIDNGLERVKIFIKLKQKFSLDNIPFIRLFCK